VLQPVPVAQPVYQAPPPRPVVAQAPPAADGSEADVERHLQLLADPDERVRADSVMQLGRMRAQRAVDPLAATLAGDRSPTVRDAAARALGLIGSPQAIPALQRAAQADNDRDVRHSAQFAIDVVQSNR
jgi:HEAT repeat protein